MRYSTILSAALAINNVYAISVAEVRSASADALLRVRDALPTFPVVEKRKAAACPAIWTSVVKDLTAMFIDKSVTPSQCNDDARAAIRVCSIY